MNRLWAVWTLDGSMLVDETIKACQFNTPHWQADHHAIYVEDRLVMSATQRFITPQCHAGLMPYQDIDSGCLINADVYLTNRETLCALLAGDLQTADAVLLLQAYLKWGERCTQYLAGSFCFIIWDPRQQQLFAAVDQFAHCPLFYVYRPGQCLIVANECSPFHALCPSLTLNTQCFVDFARDKHSATETAYQEIHKLPPGHQVIITAQTLCQQRYWCWKNQRKTLPCQTRGQYYAAFQQHFERAVQRCSRRLGPLTTQVSGGLDSSAVTAQAALLLAQQQHTVSAFTSIPNHLSGESYRPGWYYHELPRIEALLEQYSNIHHIAYTATPGADIFEKLKPLQRCFDRPLRNINNFDWTLACYEQVLAQQGRVLLIGAGGNGTISWAGTSLSERLKACYVALKAKALGRPHRWIRDPHEVMLSGCLTAPLRASVYALQLWYGVRRLDPTQELELSVFCYNVPQWVYRSGKQPLQQRLLTREGLSQLLPEAIAQNPYRGEQGADWYLHYNHHRQRWRDHLLALTPGAQEILWQSYDRQKIMALFETYPYLHQPPDRKMIQDICLQLFRCLSMGFYLSR